MILRDSRVCQISIAQFIETHDLASVMFEIARELPERVSRRLRRLLEKKDTSLASMRDASTLFILCDIIEKLKFIKNKDAFFTTTHNFEFYNFL